MGEFIITGTTNPLTIQLDEFMTNSHEYEIGLKTISMYNTVPNIDTHNHLFAFRFKSENVWIKIYLETGAYEIKDVITSIYNEFELRMQQRTQYSTETSNETDFVPYSEIFKITPDPGTMKTTITIYNTDFEIDFSCKDSIGKVFGFNRVIGYGSSKSENIINIQDLNTVLVHCDLIRGANYNGKKSQCIYEFSPSVPHGFMMCEKEQDPCYYKILPSVVDRIEIKLTDQNLKVLNTRSENITIRLRYRKSIT